MSNTIHPYLGLRLRYVPKKSAVKRKAVYALDKQARLADSGCDSSSSALFVSNWINSSFERGSLSTSNKSTTSPSSTFSKPRLFAKFNVFSNSRKRITSSSLVFTHSGRIYSCCIFGKIGIVFGNVQLIIKFTKKCAQWHGNSNTNGSFGEFFTRNL